MSAPRTGSWSWVRSSLQPDERDGQALSSFIERPIRQVSAQVFRIAADAVDKVGVLSPLEADPEDVESRLRRDASDMTDLPAIV